MMKSRTMKFLSMLMVVLMLVASLSGCATTGQDRWGNAKKGSILGAIGGAALGLAMGDFEGALIGAASGAVAGAAIGAVIDHVQYKNAPQVVKEYGADRRLAVEDMSVSKQIFQDGEQGKLNVKYVVINPESNEKKNTVKQTIEIVKGEQVVLSREDTQKITTGGYEMNFPIEIPKGADEGEYKVTAKLEAPDINRSASETRSFRVLYARNDQGALYLAQVTPY